MIITRSAYWLLVENCRGNYREVICACVCKVAVKWRLSALLPQWLEWHPCALVLLAGTDDGNMWMWKIPSGDCKTFQSSACQATTGKVLPDGERWDNRTQNLEL